MYLWGEEINRMAEYTLIKLSRGEYQVIRPDGSNYFPAPVSKWDASQAIQDEKVHARFLVHSGVRKAVHRFVNRRSLKVDSVDTFIYGFKTFIEVFKEKLGKHYISPYEKEAEKMFADTRQELGFQLHAIDEVKEAIKNINNNGYIAVKTP